MEDSLGLWLVQILVKEFKSLKIAGRDFLGLEMLTLFHLWFKADCNTLYLNRKSFDFIVYIVDKKNYIY